MLQRVTSFALHQPFFLILLTALFIAGGMAAFRALPVEAFPDVTDTQVQIITLFPGRAAEEVEKQVTSPIEIGLSGIPHSLRLFSHTQFGLSFIVVTFDDGVDAYFSRQQVIERLRDVDLPRGVESELGPLATPIGEIYRYRMKSDSADAMELRTLQDWVVERRLKTVPGVADVVTYGGFVKQYQVQPDLAKLKSYNITLRQLFEALERGSANAGGSYVEKGEQQYLIRGLGLLKSPDDIANLVVAERRGPPLLVKDIAAVEVGAVPRQGITGQDNEDDVVTGIVLMRKGENPSEVLKALKEKINALNTSVLPKAVTVTSALIGSLIFSLTLVPLLCYFLLRKRLSERENFVVRACKRLYRPSLDWALEHRRMVIAVSVVLLAASLFTATRLGSEFLPELNEGTMWVNINFPPGISVSETRRLTARVRDILRSHEVVRSVTSKAGRPEDGTDPNQSNIAEFFVDLKPPEEWPKRLTSEKLTEELDKQLDELPGVEPSFSQPIRDNVLESISQIDGQIIVKVFGADGDTLREQALKTLNAVSSVRGVARAFIDRYGQVPQLQIEVDRAKAARYGLKVADIQDVIETALGGKQATEIWEGEKKFAVVVRLPEEQRRMDNIKAILVDEMKEKVNREVQLPSGYYITWGGEFENQERAMRRLALIVPVSVLLIFALLFNAFGSPKSALLILLNVPFALIGGVFALLFTGINLSVSAAIGFIALFGQAVLNGVVMVSCFNQLRDEGETSHHAVLKGSLVRLRTVLMTALLAMLGLLPMALSHGIGSETQKPLAVVIIGGLISATLLTLFVLPALYLIFNRDDRRQAPPDHRRPQPVREEVEVH